MKFSSTKYILAGKRQYYCCTEWTVPLTCKWCSSELFEKFYFVQEIIFSLLNEMRPKKNPYFITELKYVKEIRLKLRSIFQGQGYE
jgi:hypothetical protein